MFTKSVARKTTDWLVQGGQVAEEKRVVYEFGLDKLLSLLINFFFALLLGLLFGVFWQTVVFYTAYIMLRVYAGGYHAERSIICFFASIAVLIPCLIAIRFYQAWSHPVAFYVLLAASSLALVALGPVEHKSKPLDAVEKVVYRRRMIRNLTIVSLGAIALTMFSVDGFAVAALCGVLLSATTAGVGKVKS